MYVVAVTWRDNADEQLTTSMIDIHGPFHNHTVAKEWASFEYDRPVYEGHCSWEVKPLVLPR